MKLFISFFFLTHHNFATVTSYVPFRPLFPSELVLESQYIFFPFALFVVPTKEYLTWTVVIRESLTHAISTYLPNFLVATFRSLVRLLISNVEVVEDELTCLKEWLKPLTKLDLVFRIYVNMSMSLREDCSTADCSLIIFSYNN